MDIREIEKKLKAPFPAEDLEWRIQRSGVQKTGKPWAVVFAYVTARAIYDRLDSVLGMNNWKNEYVQWQGGVVCKLSIRVDGEWITKEDGADPTDVEPFKGAISGAIKRAAVPFGLGSYLYNLESNFAVITEKGQNTFSGSAKDAEGKTVFFNWLPPELPAWALPSKEVETKIVEDKAKEQVAKLAQRKDTKVNQDAGAEPKTTPKSFGEEEIRSSIEKAKTLEELRDSWMLALADIKGLPEDKQKVLVKLKDGKKDLLSANATG